MRPAANRRDFETGPEIRLQNSGPAVAGPASTRAFLQRPKPIVIGLLLFLLVFLVFLPSIRNGFVEFDDDIYVYANPHLQNVLRWESVRWAFANLDAGFWHPLTWLSLMLDRQLFGPGAGGHHFTSLLLHAANTVLLFAVLRRTTTATWRSAFVAALFAVHPLHVESVAWVFERKDVLCAFFWMLVLWAYVRYAERSKVAGNVAIQEWPVTGSHHPSRTKRHTSRFTFQVSRLSGGPSMYYALALFFFALGLMSKTMIVTLPFILLLLDWWPLRRFQSSTAAPQTSSLSGPAGDSDKSRADPAFSALFLEKLPFFGAAVLCGLLTLRAQQAAGALADASQFPLLDRVCNAALSYSRYLAQTVWPRHLAVFYPYPATVSIWSVALAALLFLLVSALALGLSRRLPHVLFGWAWYVLTLLPVIGLVQVGGQSHADRYTYLPLIGVFLLTAWSAYDLTQRWPKQPVILSALATAVVLLCVTLTRQQISYWRNSETLFLHTIAATQNNQRAHNNLGTVLLAKGELDAAIGHFREAIKIAPQYADALNNLGAALVRKGGEAEAGPPLLEALTLRPDFAQAHFNLAVALSRQGRLDEAIAHFKQGLRRSAEDAEANAGLGAALARKGQADEAINYLQTALKLNPGLVEAHCNLGVTLARQGHLDEAITHLQDALTLKPDYAEAHCNLAAAFSRQARLDEAIAHSQQALKLSPDYVDAHCTLGVALGKTGRLDEAIIHFREALRLRPDNAEAQINLRTALAAKAAASIPPVTPLNP